MNSEGCASCSQNLLLDPFRNWWWFMSTIKNLLSVLICSMLWNKELIFDLLRGEVVCIVWLVHCVVTYWQSIAFRPALAASRSACLPAREMTHFHMWHACSLSLQWDTAKTTLSQLPQTLCSHLLRWLAAYLVHLATHLFVWNCPHKVEVILYFASVSLIFQFVLLLC